MRVKKKAKGQRPKPFVITGFEKEDLNEVLFREAKA